MKKQILAVASAALVAVMSVVPAFAQEISTGSVTIEPGIMSLDVANITFDNVAVDGVHNMNLPGTTTVWTATDYTGDGVGWTLQINAGAFSGPADDALALMDTFEMQVPLIELVTDGTAAEGLTNSFATTQTLSGGAHNVITAGALQGMGQYEFTPQFKLDVPDTTLVGTYTSIINVTMAFVPE